MDGQNVKVFLSYSHLDNEDKVLFVQQLSSLVRSEGISVWADDKIPSGSEWNKEIKKQITSSDLILLLISPAFIASEFCYNEELKVAIEMHEQSKAVVVPIGLRMVDITNLSFSKLQMLPKGQPPFVEKWPNKNEAFVEIIKELRNSIEYIVTELWRWNPIARKDSIRKLIESANYSETCNKIIDFVTDFSENDDLKDLASSIKSDFTDLCLLMKKIEENPTFTGIYDQYLQGLKKLKEAMFSILKQVIAEQKKGLN